MEYVMRISLIFACLLILSACGTGQFGSSYKGYSDPRLAADLVALPEEGEPNLIRSTDLDRDVRQYREHNYVVVGESAFNGVQESPNNAVKKAKEVGATHVIVSSEYTDTRGRLAYDYQDYYRTIYVNKVRSVNGKSVRYREAVTVRDTVTVPYTQYYDNFDQWAIYMAKSTRVHKLGLIMRDLAPNERSSLGRNTGAFIDMVLSNSPAFMADIVPQDILVAINGDKVNNTNHAEELIRVLELDGKTIVLTVLKNGEQKDITFEFNES